LLFPAVQNLHESNILTQLFEHAPKEPTRGVFTFPLVKKTYLGRAKYFLK
jgi:hypothetical protein